jgi:hypothetical protein
LVKSHLPSCGRTYTRASAWPVLDLDSYRPEAALSLPFLTNA